ncbi:MAG TPA: threonine ammonia-lyase [Acidobacteriota bacterium]|jgi:threonine dehydratase
MPGNHLAEIRAARQRISHIAKRTPQIHDTTLSQMAGCNLSLKQEIFQRTGSFKIRGAFNKLSQLDPDCGRAGVVTTSAGNHAQGVAHSAHLLGYPSFVFMPESTPLAKIEATRHYGAQVMLRGNTFEAASREATEFQKQNRLTYIHGFDDWHIIYGAGTVGLEIIEDCPDAEIIVCPVGGGGLISGVALAARELNPAVKIIGVQADSAPAAFESFKRGEPVERTAATTIAEGIAIKKPGDLNLEIIMQMVDDMILVSDSEIADAILYLLERTKLVCEGAGAAAVAGLLTGKVPVSSDGRQVVAILSGGNIDLRTLSTIITRGQAKSGRFLQFSVNVLDAPGNLKKLVDEISAMKANIIDVLHNRTAPDLPLGYVKIDIIAETRNRRHAEEILQDLQNLGYHPAATI